MPINTLKSVAKIAPLVFFNAFHRLEQASQLGRIALIFDNTRLLANPLRIQWVGARYHMKEWKGERATQAVFAHDYHIEDRSWEASVEFDRLDYQRPESVSNAVPHLESMARAVVRGKLNIAMEVPSPISSTRVADWSLKRSATRVPSK